MALKPLLQNCAHYFGSDIIPAENVLQCNLEERLPFDDNAFDIVTALDVLEHLDNPHSALQELFRVAKKSVLISLPNMHYIYFRFNFLLGGGISGKYHFPVTPILDRHRWILSYTEAKNFIYQNAGKHLVEHEMIIPARERTRAVSEPIQKWLAEINPDLFAYGILFEISLNKS